MSAAAGKTPARLLDVHGLGMRFAVKGGPFDRLLGRPRREVTRGQRRRPHRGPAAKRWA